MKFLGLISAASVLASTSLSFSDDILKNADIGYGEYLSGECVTCHRINGADDGIPNIIGLDAVGFAYIMKAYKDKELDNKVMQLVAKRLDQEQIASLAVYFKSLGD